MVRIKKRNDGKEIKTYDRGFPVGVKGVGAVFCTCFFVDCRRIVIVVLMETEYNANDATCDDLACRKMESFTSTIIFISKYCIMKIKKLVLRELWALRWSLSVWSMK